MALIIDKNNVKRTHALGYAFEARVAADSGTVDNITQIEEALVDIGEDNVTPDLAMIPAAYKAGKLYSVIPSTGDGDLAVTGGGNAVSQRSDGTWQINWPANTPRYTWNDGLPSILVESQRQNLITYPRSFGNAYWTKSGATIEGDPTTAGTNLVGTLDFTTGWITVSATVNSANSFTTTAPGGIYLSIPAIVVGGFYRLKIKGTQTVGKTLIFPNTNVPSISTEVFDLELTGNASVVKNLYINSQSGNTVTFEILEYATISPKAYECPFINSSGVNTLEGVKLVEDESNGGHYIFKNSIPIAASTTYTFSIYAKKAEREWIYILIPFVGGTAITQSLYFNLTTGLFGTVSPTITASSELLTNGFYKITITSTSNSTNTSCNVNITPALSNNNFSYQGDGTSGIYICHAQLEQAESASSPIYGAEGSALTRNADVITKTGASDLIGQTEGTVLINVNITKLGFTRHFFSLQTTTWVAENIRLETQSPEALRLTIRSASAVVKDVPSANSKLVLGLNKIAVAYKTGTNQVVVYNNGEKIIETTTTIIPTLDGVVLGARSTNIGVSSEFELNDLIESISIIKTRLTNDQLQALTTL